MKFRNLLTTILAVTAVGCATIPGKTGLEQTQSIDELVSRTLLDLEKQHPNSKEEIAKSVGYVIMNNKITKIPVFGAGGGYGVAIDQKSGEKTYLRMARFDFGAGWGARSVRPIIIFNDEKKFRGFADGMFQIKMSAEASAKVGDKGAAGGTGSKDDKEALKTGYTAYLLTDAGVSATWAVGFIRVKPIRLKK